MSNKYVGQIIKLDLSYFETSNISVAMLASFAFLTRLSSLPSFLSVPLLGIVDCM